MKKRKGKKREKERKSRLGQMKIPIDRPGSCLHQLLRCTQHSTRRGPAHTHARVGEGKLSFLLSFSFADDDTVGFTPRVGF